ncbi:hypothetical protein QZM42_05400 [Burkholderia vietnamiensis]|uniref:hypothetical protein n=1 Tax=Burkholderia vietnamiensis TaxID=60552 RepID=UPI002653E3B7|nr:hypothetical protein [Burkholderia vietnamiensis]MDN7407980.1 hypothetical protein [Burkholderia vietnamiensis]
MTLKTRQDKDIRGGGVTKDIATFSIGPRNLLKATAALRKLLKQNEQCYGNVGCGHSWLEINGSRVFFGSLRKLEYADTDPRYEMTRTQKANDLLADVLAGYYNE